jgi:hypothetical protein
MSAPLPDIEELLFERVELHVQCDTVTLNLLCGSTFGDSYDSYSGQVPDSGLSASPLSG